jgi:hypothetical protein
MPGVPRLLAYRVGDRRCQAQADFSGDSGLTDEFQHVGKTFGPFDLAVLEPARVEVRTLAAQATARSR